MEAKDVFCGEYKELGDHSQRKVKRQGKENSCQNLFKNFGEFFGAVALLFLGIQFIFLVFGILVAVLMTDELSVSLSI